MKSENDKFEKLAENLDFKRYMLAIHYCLEKKFNSFQLKKGSKSISKKGFYREITQCIKFNKSLKQFKCLKIASSKRQSQ